ncbi:MAG: ExeM/NucH family extracellular endonuclease [Roseiflexaceae bacterium]
MFAVPRRARHAWTHLVASATLVATALTSLFIAPQTFAATPTELFISEYIEGSSNNKAIEIYNGTGAAIDLAANAYSIQVFFNGATTANLTINLTGTVADGDVFVLAQAAANATILAQADQTNSAGWFNGDDAVVLRKGTTVIDSIGVIGTDPGTEWGTGLTSTADNTLRRKSAITTGDTNTADAFDPSTEWDGFANDTFDGLGSHTITVATDTAPTVTAVVPTSGATDVAANSTITVTFSEPVTVGSAAFSLACDATNVALTVSGGPTTYTLTPAAALAESAVCTLTVTAAEVSDQDGIAPLNMAANFVSSFSVAGPPPAPCAAIDTPIGTVQGEDDTADITGLVTIQGVVVGDYEGAAPALRGFYLQDAGDGNPLTSDGIFVFNGSNNSVSLGQVVQVTGTAGEFQGQTQLSGTLTIVDCGATEVVTPVDIAMPFPAAVGGVAYLERYEGMLVRLAQKAYVTEFFQLGRFGEVLVSSGARLSQPTNIFAPGPDATALQAANDLNQILLDDSSQAQNPDPILFARGGNPLSASNTLRGGDSVENVVGILNYTWAGNAASPNAYRIRPLNALGGGIPNFVAENARPSAPPAVGGRLKASAFNVLNYFLTLDIGTTPACGPLGNKQECRGAETAVELDRQQQKLTQALISLDADVLGLIELENTQDANGNDVNPLADIVARLNAVAGAGTYSYINTGIIGGDTIRVGIIYKPAKVTPIGAFQTLDSSDDPRFNSSIQRPSLAQTFEENFGGARFTFVVNHFKSKGCTGSTGLEADQLDGQGCWNLTRTLAAQALVDWLASDPTGSGDPDYLLVGDLNSYAMEDPIRAILAGSDDSASTGDDFVNLIKRFGGELAYSYVFDGQWGYLDHALASATLNSQVVGAGEYHINSDEPSVLDYNTNFKTANLISTLFAADPFRTSDHDPVVIGLDLLAPTPVTSASVAGSAPAGCPSDCYFGSATVTLSTDRAVEKTEYRINGGALTTYTGPFAITTEGTNTVSFFSTGVTGVVESSQAITVKVTRAPSTAILDSFNRANGGLGNSWQTENRNGYRVDGNGGLALAGEAAYWRGPSAANSLYGSNQEAYMTLVNATGAHQSLLLKVQTNRSGVARWKNGYLAAYYDSVRGVVAIQSYIPAEGFRDVATYAVVANPGDKLGAVALADGTVKVYLNCNLLGSANVPFFAGKGGRIGIWFEGSNGARFDDFGGGNVAP